MGYKGWLESLSDGQLEGATLRLYGVQDQTIACGSHFCGPTGPFCSVSELPIKDRMNIWVFCCNLPALWMQNLVRPKDEHRKPVLAATGT